MVANASASASTIYDWRACMRGDPYPMAQTTCGRLWCNIATARLGCGQSGAAHAKVTLHKHKNMEQVGRNHLLLPNSFSIELECAHVVGAQHFKLQYNTLYRD